MPTAHGGAPKKYWLQDHDTALIQETPPVLNQWYTIIDEEDVRLLEIYFYQYNDETDNKTIEMRWTLDGNIYFVSIDAINNQQYWVYRDGIDSAVGTRGLSSAITKAYAYLALDKRALSAKIEIRIVSALGTNQGIEAYVNYETLEET